MLLTSCTRPRLRQRPLAQGFTLLARVAAAQDFVSAAGLALPGIRKILAVRSCTLLWFDPQSAPQVSVDAAPDYNHANVTQLGLSLIDALQQCTIQYPAFTADRLELQPTPASGATAALLAAPLKLGQQLLGVLWVEVDCPRRWTRPEVALVEAVAAQLTTTLDSQRRFMALHRVDELAAACQAVITCSAGLDVVATAGIIVEQAARATGAHQAELYLLTRNQVELEPVANYPFAGHAREHYGRLVDSLVGRAALTGTPEWLNKHHPQTGRADTRHSPSADVALAVPLLHNQELVGVLVLVYSPRATHSADADIAAIQRFASHAAAALTNARRYSEAAQRAQRMVELARATQVLDAQADISASIQPLAHQSMHVLGAQGCIVALCSESGHYETHVVGLSAAQAAILRNNPAFQRLFHDELVGHPTNSSNPALERQPQLDQAARMAGFATQLTLPLTRDDQLIGFVTYLYRRHHAWSDDDAEIARVIANQMTALLANARLYHALHETSRLKSEFIATVSHELRTPMGAIMGYAELLASGSYGVIPNTMHDPLGRLKANADNLLLLINQMLDLSRIEAGRLELHMEPFQPADLLQAVASAAQTQLQGKPITLHVEVMDAVPRIVLGDVGRLRQMLGNLVDNGLKFTQRGAVVLRCSRVDQPSGAKLVFDVVDSGPGIAEDKLAVIWEPFRQGNSSQTRTHSGAGLGLTIVDKLSKLMGGTASVTSRLGIGSTFTIQLPLRLPQP